MATRRDHLTIPQGTTWGYAWPILDDEGLPLVMTGYNARAQVRATVASTLVLWEWNTDDGTASVAGSRVTLLLTPEQSTAWEFTDGVYDLELTDDTGRVARITGGKVHVEPEVTR